MPASRVIMGNHTLNLTECDGNVDQAPDYNTDDADMNLYSMDTGNYGAGTHLYDMDNSYAVFARQLFYVNCAVHGIGMPADKFFDGAHASTSVAPHSPPRGHGYRSRGLTILT